MKPSPNLFVRLVVYVNAPLLITPAVMFLGQCPHLKAEDSPSPPTTAEASKTEIPKRPDLKDASVILKITTTSGIDYSNVRVSSRNGDSVRFSHSDGFKTLKFSELERASAELMGVGDYEKEIAAAEQASINRAKAESLSQQRAKDARKTRIEAEVVKFNELKIKENKTIDDWCAMAELRHVWSVERMKQVVGKPPSDVFEQEACWRDACWNKLSEKREHLWVKKISEGTGFSFRNYILLRSGNETRRINIPNDEKTLIEATEDEAEKIRGETPLMIQDSDQKIK